MKGWSLHKKQDIVDHGELGEETAWCNGIDREVNSTTPRAIQRGSNSKSNADDDAGFMKGLSAPVNIPDWSKVYGKKQKRKKNEKIMVASDEDEDHNNNDDDDEEEEEEDEDEGEAMLPPHEWLARKHVRSQISSFSVCEGVGRTLKGRDLSRVRNAILTKTGFLERTNTSSTTTITKYYHYLP